MSCIQSYEIKLPLEAFLDGRSLNWKKFRYKKFQICKQDSRALIQGNVVFTNLNITMSHCAACLNFQQRKATEFQITKWFKEVT